MTEEEEEERFRTDDKYQKREDKLRAAVLYFLAVIVLAGASGGAGYAWWTKKTTGNTSEMMVQYERMLRCGRPTPLVVVANGKGRDTMKISLSSTYVKDIEFKNIRPVPLSVTTSSTEQVYNFLGTGSGPRTVRFETSAQSAGWKDCLVKTRASSVFIHQFVLP